MARTPQNDSQVGRVLYGSYPSVLRADAIPHLANSFPRSERTDSSKTPMERAAALFGRHWPSHRWFVHSCFGLEWKFLWSKPRRVSKHSDSEAGQASLPTVHCRGRVWLPERRQFDDYCKNVRRLNWGGSL